jgi:hypothetical protein
MRELVEHTREPRVRRVADVDRRVAQLVHPPLERRRVLGREPDV